MIDDGQARRMPADGSGGHYSTLARTQERRSAAGENVARFRALVRRLERHWPLSAALILLAIVVLGFIRAG